MTTLYSYTPSLSVTAYASAFPLVLTVNAPRSALPAPLITQTALTEMIIEVQPHGKEAHIQIWRLSQLRHEGHGQRTEFGGVFFESLADAGELGGGGSEAGGEEGGGDALFGVEGKLAKRPRGREREETNSAGVAKAFLTCGFGEGVVAE